jgi:hypothetical protein
MLDLVSPAGILVGGFAPWEVGKIKAFFTKT